MYIEESKNTMLWFQEYLCIFLFYVKLDILNCVYSMNGKWRRAQKNLRKRNTQKENAIMFSWFRINNECLMRYVYIIGYFYYLDLHKQF